MKFKITQESSQLYDHNDNLRGFDNCDLPKNFTDPANGKKYKSVECFSHHLDVDGKHREKLNESGKAECLHGHKILGQLTHHVSAEHNGRRVDLDVAARPAKIRLPFFASTVTVVAACQRENS